MPEINFKGKQIVYAHHLTVPLRTLEPDAFVFASHKFMGQKELTEMGITFARLPYAGGGG